MEIGADVKAVHVHYDMILIVHVGQLYVFGPKSREGRVVALGGDRTILSASTVYNMSSQDPMRRSCLYAQREG